MSFLDDLLGFDEKEERLLERYQLNDIGVFSKLIGKKPEFIEFRLRYTKAGLPLVTSAFVGDKNHENDFIAKLGGVYASALVRTLKYGKSFSELKDFFLDDLQLFKESRIFSNKFKESEILNDNKDKPWVQRSTFSKVLSSHESVGPYSVLRFFVSQEVINDKVNSVRINYQLHPGAITLGKEDNQTAFFEVSRIDDGGIKVDAKFDGQLYYEYKLNDGIMVPNCDQRILPRIVTGRKDRRVDFDKVLNKVVTRMLAADQKNVMTHIPYLIDGRPFFNPDENLKDDEMNP